MHRLPLSPLKYTVGVHRLVMVKWRGMGCMTTVTWLLNVTPPKFTFSVHGRVVMRCELYGYDHFTWYWICWPLVGFFYFFLFFWGVVSVHFVCVFVCVVMNTLEGAKHLNVLLKASAGTNRKQGLRGNEKNVWVWKMKNRVRQEACVCLFLHSIMSFLLHR